MPIYEYRCEECAQVFEEWQNDFEERDVPCPVCGGNSRRLISHSAFILKGSGWYATDYSRKSSPQNGNGNGNGNKDKKDKSEAASGESAPSSKDSSKEGAKNGSGEGSGAKNKSASSQAGAAQ